MGDKLSSITPNIFKPIIKINDAKNKVQYAPPIEEKTLPLKAQNIPIALKTKLKPKTKERSCKNVLSLLVSPYPPTYPIIKGKTPIEQGEIEARTPPKNEIKRKSRENSPF